MQEIFLLCFVSFLIFIAPFANSLTGVPVVVAEILLGAVTANCGLFDDFLAQSSAFKALSNIGFLFLMFLAGIEVDLRGFRALFASFLWRVVAYFGVIYGLSIALVFALSLPLIYIIALPVMSLGMVMILLQEHRGAAWLELSLKIGIIGELISIILLVLLNGYYSFGLGLEFVRAFFVLFAFLAAIMVVFKISDILFWCFPILRQLLIPDSNRAHQDLRYSVMLFFLMIVIVSLLDIQAALGAFISGLIIANFFRYKKELHAKLNDFGFGFFVPLFFIYIGTTLDFGAIFAERRILLNAAVICALMLAIRFAATSVALGRILGDFRGILLFSLSNTMPLTFLIATATLGRSIGALDLSQYYAFMLAAMFEAMVFMVVIKALSCRFAKK